MHPQLNELIAEAANVYAATGNTHAISAAGLLRSLAASPLSSAAPKQTPDLASPLSSMSDSAIKHLLESTAAHLPWSSGDGSAPEGFAGRFASAEVVGPDGVLPTQDLRFGFYWQPPATFYPSHSHAAEELYLVLSGNPLWQKDDASFAAVAPGMLVHHAPFQRHAMRTGRDGLLAMWIWIGDLSFASYRFHETT
jgi:hypothetical protein